MKKIIAAFLLGAGAAAMAYAASLPVQYAVSQEVTIRSLGGASLDQLQTQIEADGYVVIYRDVANNYIRASKLLTP